MDPRLFEASQTGNVDQLYSLVRENVLILDVASLVDGYNPLHVASLAGHVNFVREILKLKMELADELNQDGFSPLHIAAARGDVDIVRELLKVGSRLCLVKGREERIPLHYSVIKGRSEVLKELVLACPDSIEEVTARRESALHLAVKNSRFEALKLLVQQLKLSNKEHILNWQDGQGNRILHLAVARKQYEVVKFLLSGDAIDKDMIEVNARNEAGLTPLDSLLLVNNEASDVEIVEILTRSGATRGTGLPSGSMVTVATEEPQPQTDQSNENGRRSRRTWTDRCPCFLKVSHERDEWFEEFQYKKGRDSPGDVRNALLVIAALIATATYQAVLQPPGGLWQADSGPSTNGTNATTNGTASYKAGQSVLGTTNEVAFMVFLIFNTTGFFASLQMIYILTWGFPMQRELRVAMLALIMTYDFLMPKLAPNAFVGRFFFGLSIAVPFMLGILGVWPLKCTRRPRHAV
ncbi:ankyrin repeat-containing protein BDA1 [Eucalyptus grandis]|uniref:ankyrin repeat-containing protein BDA1 n=1 Tax=Eucalyptus grandis TaxID=71139 RepID=UPI000526CAEC|nr:ankyrin repeat-containing protein BDA1 [Eucalyptus grandis]XP_039168869.1 ankyrin repeat-containing protein BDA1 [Eucalyptus grandis]